MNGPLDVDDYAVTHAQAAWLNIAHRTALESRLNGLDYSWNMHGQEDERERALMRAIEDRLDYLDTVPADGAP